MEPGTVIDSQSPPPPPEEPAKQESKPEHIKQSHSFLFVYLLVIVVAITAGAVYAWQHSSVSSLKKQLNGAKWQIATLQSQVDLLTKPQPGATNANNPLDYKDWKTFCDSINSACFRYPQDWNLTNSSNSSKASVALNNPNTTLALQYNDPVTTKPLNQVYYIVDIKELNKTDLGLKIIERVIGNTPDFVIVDDSYLRANSVSVGKTLSFMDDARFTSKTTKASAQLYAKPSGQTLTNITTTDQAVAWFKTDDAANCLKVLRSYYYQ